MPVSFWVKTFSETEHQPNPRERRGLQQYEPFKVLRHLDRWVLMVMIMIMGVHGNEAPPGPELENVTDMTDISV